MELLTDRQTDRQDKYQVKRNLFGKGKYICQKTAVEKCYKGAEPSLCISVVIIARLSSY